MWEDALYLAKRSPIVGYGPGLHQKSRLLDPAQYRKRATHFWTSLSFLEDLVLFVGNYVRGALPQHIE